jgi:uncharacterized protein with ParB-like and HNH nuclease domain
MEIFEGKMDTEKEKNGLIDICDLMGLSFTIPHYQRGYRWEDQEVTELLDDLWAFQKDKDSGDFYCLQPIVLRKNGPGNYYVLDGQQRLTTLYLLLVYLEKKRHEEGYLQPLFFLNYVTRKECEKFLLEKRFVNHDDKSNIDFYYICKAYQCIDNWFNNEEHRGARGRLVSVLLDKTGKGNRNVQVIRYEVEEKTNPIDVFIRLNVGKIPLTDAELTKALLLQSDKYSSDKLEYNKMKLHNIAAEWDIIETTLQDTAFWYFLNNKSNTKETHIEFIFDLLADRINSVKQYFKDKPKKYATFLIFSEYLKDLINNGNDGEEISRIDAVEKIWSEITENFEYFKEWFQDRKLYHYIGLLIDIKNNSIINSLIQEAKILSKSKFKEYLEIEIAENVKYGKPLEELTYNDPWDKRDIRKILLLHNVYTTLKSNIEKPRFPFELYKKQEWSLEHIYARNSQPLTGIKKQKEWLNDHIKSLSNSNTDSSFNELINKMKEIMQQDEIDNDIFNNIENEVYEVIEKCFEFGSNENIDLIKNLCLLDKATNSQLNNSIFDVKREKIKKRELKGFYIPVCTRNVFLKAYTSDPATNAYWTKKDRDDYFKDIESVYSFFVNKINGTTK